MIINVNLSDDFAEKLAHLVVVKASTPLQMAQIHIILPTKRACRTLKEAFVRLYGEKAFLLPKMTALYELNVLQEDIPQAISSLERMVLLAKICRTKPNIDTLDKSLIVASSLCEILDEFYQQETDLDKLESLVTDIELAQHWNETIEFLNIIRQVWPEYLKKRNLIDETDRRIRLINAFSNQMMHDTSDTPVIMAGFDGALPAIARLINILNNKKNATILIQGLNTTLDNDDLSYIYDQHYQFNLKKLLKTLHIAPSQVQTLSSDLSLREELLIEAMKPAQQTDDWRSFSLDDQALDNLTYIECENISQEALTIAILLRQVLETDQKRATLVTNNRLLARRVILEMKRWGVDLDDSAGTPLNHTPVGIFLLLLAIYATNGQKGIDLLALLKHPLCADNENPTLLRSKIKEAEKQARKDQTPLNYQLNTDMSQFLALATSPVEVSFKELLTQHIDVAQKLATSHDKTGFERLWGSTAGENAFNFLSQLLIYADKLGNIHPSLYVEVLTFLLEKINVRLNYGMHNRLDILGPIEARLSHADVCIISSLNEGSFPTLPESGPWLSRQMRHDLKLPDLENKIAVQEMDFLHCCCAKEVYLTRATKADGSQTIPSRFLARIEAVLSACDKKLAIQKPTLATLLDKAESFETISRPAPKPDKSVRPKELSATKVELLMKNPYAIYAKYILNLRPLKELSDVDKNSAYGSAVHKGLELFVQKPKDQQTAETLRQDIFNELNKQGFLQTDLVFLTPRVEKTIEFIIKTQQSREAWTDKITPEKTGSYTFQLDDGSDFKLTATADRIDTLKDNAYEIIDYKTGSTPSYSEVASGFSPQLAIEGIILRENGFENLPAKNDIRLSYWHLTGRQAGGEIRELHAKEKENKTINDLLDETQNGIKNLMNTFNQNEMPYEASPRPDKVKYNDYAHLAREAEWLNADESGED